MMAHVAMVSHAAMAAERRVLSAQLLQVSECRNLPRDVAAHTAMLSHSAIAAERRVL
jgi:hypothetical protein